MVSKGKIMGIRKTDSKGKIHKYKKPFQINIGLIIFGVIFVYILVMAVMYGTSKHIVGYEVKTGQLTESNFYTGLAIREEKVVLSNQNGYISYFVPESTRVGVGDIVCAIDQGDELENILKENMDGSSNLETNKLFELKEKIQFFETNFSNDFFSGVYDLEKDLDIAIAKFLSSSLKENLKMANDDIDFKNLEIQTATDTGIVVYNIDGYEDFIAEDITDDDFIDMNYSKTDFVSNELIVEDTPIYKMITNEFWSVIIKVEEERIAGFEEGDYVKVRFLKNQMESWAMIHPINNENGSFVELKFTNSMITFSKDRFIELELLTEEEEGLKIPNSAIIEKTFFLIPKDYVYTENEGSRNNYFVMLEYYNEEGVKSVKKIVLNVYSENEEEYYIDSSFLDYGNKLIMNDSVSFFMVNKIGTLVGVYNINKGYADFTQITILYSNDEYSIIKSNTKYGLSDYDYIVLDALSVEDDDLLY